MFRDILKDSFFPFSPTHRDTESIHFKTSSHTHTLTHTHTHSLTHTHTHSHTHTHTHTHPLTHKHAHTHTYTIQITSMEPKGACRIEWSEYTVKHHRFALSVHVQLEGVCSVEVLLHACVCMCVCMCVFGCKRENLHICMSVHVHFCL